MCIGIIDPELHNSGYDSCSSNLLKSAVVNVSSWLWNILKTKGGSPSKPGALFFFKAFKAALTSNSSIGSSKIGIESTFESIGLVEMLSVLSPKRDLKYASRSSTRTGISSSLDWFVILLIWGLIDLNSLNSKCNSAIASRVFLSD